MEVKYKIFDPSGNITALVIGDNYTKEEKIKINNLIMKKERNVEQVGFLSQKETKLTMAGGEFCGNATRSAAKYYLEKNNLKEVTITINSYLIKCGLKDGEIWCEMPIDRKEELVEEVTNDITKVNLSGITIILLDYDEKDDLKEKTMNLIDKLNLTEKEAVGVIFKQSDYKIIPVVWVKSINTLFEENSCGSGTIGYAISENLKNGKTEFEVMQPSGKALRVDLKNKIILSGKITEEKEETISF